MGSNGSKKIQPRDSLVDQIGVVEAGNTSRASRYTVCNESMPSKVYGSSLRDNQSSRLSSDAVSVKVTPSLAFNHRTSNFTEGCLTSGKKEAGENRRETIGIERFGQLHFDDQGLKLDSSKKSRDNERKKFSRPRKESDRMIREDGDPRNGCGKEDVEDDSLSLEPRDWPVPSMELPKTMLGLNSKIQTCGCSERPPASNSSRPSPAITPTSVYKTLNDYQHRVSKIKSKMANHMIIFGHVKSEPAATELEKMTKAMVKSTAQKDGINNQKIDMRGKFQLNLNSQKVKEFKIQRGKPNAPQANFRVDIQNPNFLDEKSKMKQQAANCQILKIRDFKVKTSSLRPSQNPKNLVATRCHEVHPVSNFESCQRPPRFCYFDRNGDATSKTFKSISDIENLSQD